MNGSYAPPRPRELVLTTAAAVLSASALSGQAAPPDPTERIARIESSLTATRQIEGRPTPEYTIAERLAHHGVPGVSLAVIDEGELAWAKGYGVRDESTGEPVTPATLFQAASISKPVAVMGMLRLVDEGTLELDAPVDRYLRSWTVPDHDFDEPVTLRRLASHTAGTTVHGFPGYPRSAERPGTAGVLRGEGNTAPVVVDLEPGSEWRYSGGGTTVLQLVVEDVTGRPFAHYMAGAVLRPAGMDRSTFEQPLPEDRRDDAATAYRSDGSAVEGGWHVYPEVAAAGLWTTPTDLVRLAIEVQRSLRGESNRVLSAATTAAMLEPVMEGYGLGFGTEAGSTGRFGHGGSNAGYRATLTAFRDGRGVAVMTNSDAGAPLAQEIVQAVAREYGWDEIHPEVLTLTPFPAARRDAFAGDYTIARTGARLTLTPTDDDLFRLTSDVVPNTLLVPVSDSALVDLEQGLRVRVEWDGDRVTRLRVRDLEVLPASGG